MKNTNTSVLRYVYVSGFVLLGLLSLPLQAGASARARLDAFAQNLHALSGHFTQTFIRADGKSRKKSTGTLALKAPREFRWDTLSPYKQTIVADGHRVWMYDPALDQVTVRKQSMEEAHSPLTVLTDLAQLDKRFRLTEQGKHDGLLWLRLTARSANPQISRVELGFDAKGLARMVLHDQLGSTTRIRFSRWKRNPHMTPGSFHFTPPKDSDVIGDTPVLLTRPLQD